MCSLGIEALIILVWYCVTAGVTVWDSDVFCLQCFDSKITIIWLWLCVCVVYFRCVVFADDTLLTHSVLSRL